MTTRTTGDDPRNLLRAVGRGDLAAAFSLLTGRDEPAERDLEPTSDVGPADWWQRVEPRTRTHGGGMCQRTVRAEYRLDAAAARAVAENPDETAERRFAARADLAAGATTITELGPAAYAMRQ